jgi:hypothetical protein
VSYDLYCTYIIFVAVEKYVQDNPWRGDELEGARYGQSEMPRRLQILRLKLFVFSFYSSPMHIVVHLARLRSPEFLP